MASATEIPAEHNGKSSSEENEKGHGHVEDAEKFVPGYGMERDSAAADNLAAEEDNPWVHQHVKFSRLPTARTSLTLMYADGR